MAKKPISQRGYGGLYGSGKSQKGFADAIRSAGIGATTGPAKGVTRPQTLPPPPPGTYDPGIDYNAQASQRGYDYTANDAQTSFEQGQQDYNLGLGDLGTQRDRTIADLTRQASDVNRQYGILANQQNQAARQHGVTSAGLLGLAAGKRYDNQQHDLQPLYTAATRANEDYTRNKLGLDLANARQFGGFNGQTIINPLTGKPEAGSLLTSLTRAGAENTAFQGYSGGLRADQAAANGYVSPFLQQQPPSKRLIDYLAGRR